VGIRLNHAKVEWVAQHRYPSTADAELLGPDFRSAISEQLSRAQLMAIGNWKSVRARSRLASNSDEAVAQFSEAAFRSDNSVVAAWTLQYLSGVRVRMASAILTIHDPDTYTVYDVRAMSTLRAVDYSDLGIPAPDWLEESGVLDSTRRYGDYLELCRSIATRCEVTLRVLDQCLWAMNGKDVEPS